MTELQYSSRLSASPGVIRRWERQCLEIYDEQVIDLLPREGFVAERRAHVVRPFDRLEMLATEG